MSSENTLKLRACSHESGVPRVPGVPQVAGSIKCLFHMHLMTPGTWGRVRLNSLHGYLARNTRIHTQNKDGGQKTNFGGKCYFPFSVVLGSSFPALWLDVDLFDYRTA